jgi:uncharacterized protein YneF (UPF0154 family)
MRTLFEDTEENANRHDDGKAKGLPLMMWVLALLMIGLAVGAYFFVQHRRQQEILEARNRPPTVPEQARATVNQIGTLAVGGKWEEIEALLSAEGRAQMEKEKKKLRDVWLAQRISKKKLDNPVQVVPVQTAVNGDAARADTGFIFADGEQLVVTFNLKKEGDKFLITGWQ